MTSPQASIAYLSRVKEMRTFLVRTSLSTCVSLCVSSSLNPFTRFVFHSVKRCVPFAQLSWPSGCSDWHRDFKLVWSFFRVLLLVGFKKQPRGQTIIWGCPKKCCQAQAQEPKPVLSSVRSPCCFQEPLLCNCQKLSVVSHVVSR